MSESPNESLKRYEVKGSPDKVVYYEQVDNGVKRLYVSINNKTTRLGHVIAPIFLIFAENPDAILSLDEIKENSYEKNPYVDIKNINVDRNIQQLKRKINDLLPEENRGHNGYIHSVMRNRYRFNPVPVKSSSEEH